MANNNIKNIREKVRNLWRLGYSLPQIEEEMMIKIELKPDSNKSISESLASGDFTVTTKQLLID